MSVVLNTELGYAFVPIQPISWKHGDEKPAVRISIILQSDNRFSSATVGYTIMDEDGKPLESDTKIMEGEEYIVGGGTNTQLYTWLASKVGVTLI